MTAPDPEAHRAARARELLADVDAQRALLHAADPDPTLDRVTALAEYSQRMTASHPDEGRFAWDAYVAAFEVSGRELTTWQAFQAGLRAAAEWAARRG